MMWNKEKGKKKMKRDLITQMRHEWKTNLWLIIELLIISAVVGFMMMYTIFIVRPLFSPKGFDDRDVVAVSIRYVDQESPEFVGAADKEAQFDLEYSDALALLDGLRRHPLVEAAGFSSNGAPYNFNYLGSELRIKGMPDSVCYNANRRTGSPDLVRVLGLQSVDGTSSEELEKRVRRGEVLLGTNDNFRRFGHGETSLAGKEVYFSYDSVKYYKVAGIVNTIRRSSYEEAWGGMVFLPVDESNPQDLFNQILIRVRPGETRRFIEQFTSDPTLQRRRNVYLTEMQSLQTMGQMANRSSEMQLRAILAVMIFFFVIVFLGLLGSFWYRVQERTPEIALRKVTGAGRGDIFRRLLSEGTLLLLPAFLLGSAAWIWFLVRKQNSMPVEWLMIGLALLLTYAMMQLMVILGILFPARKAMAVEAAEALKDE